MCSQLCNQTNCRTAASAQKASHSLTTQLPDTRPWETSHLLSVSTDLPVWTFYARNHTLRGPPCQPLARHRVCKADACGSSTSQYCASSHCCRCCTARAARCPALSGRHVGCSARGWRECRAGGPHTPLYGLVFLPLECKPRIGSARGNCWAA